MREGEEVVVAVANEVGGGADRTTLALGRGRFNVGAGGQRGILSPYTHQTHGYPLSPPFNFFTMDDEVGC
jgi:hypothetical protein